MGSNPILSAEQSSFIELFLLIIQWNQPRNTSRSPSKDVYSITDTFDFQLLTFDSPMKCKHLPPCGGCYHETNYEDQINKKRVFVNNLFGQNIELVPSPKNKGYRSRMDFVAAFDRIGLRAHGKHNFVIEIEKCHLMSERMNKVFNKIQKLVKELDISTYNFVQNEGFLRYVTIREAKFTGELMVIFLTSSKTKELSPLVEKIKPDVDSIIWSINSEFNDLNFGEVYKTFKKDHILELFEKSPLIPLKKGETKKNVFNSPPLSKGGQGGSVSYKISANTFFQSNAWVANQMFNEIRNHVSGSGLDLYCGVGTISLFVADKCEKIFGVEEIEASIKLAKENAKLNKVKNAEFLAQDTKSFLRYQFDEGGKKTKPETKYKDLDFVIVDPPRAGVSKKVCRKIMRLTPKKIIYMSCGPKTLKTDLEELTNQYDITFMKAFDMFPHTNHVEVLCVLERKK